MGFIASTDQALYAGVFPVDVTPPTVVNGVSLGYVGFCGQFAWGPRQAAYTPVDGADLINTFEPPGSPRQSTGYRAVKGRIRFASKIVRVLAADAAKALLAKAGTGGNVNVRAKYPGTLGNSIVVTIAAPTNGGTGKNITVSLTDPVTGTTSKTYQNVALPTGTLVTVDVSADLLIDTLTVDGTLTAWPANGSTNLAGGTNGSALTAADYIGTAGAADKGVALFESQGNVTVVCLDDCGDTNRVAINTGFLAHAALMGDRMACIDTEFDAASWTAVKAEVTGAYVSMRAIFSGAWCTILDDAGLPQTSPLSTFIASALVNLQPQQSHGWWDDRVTQYYAAINSIVAAFSWTATGVRQDAFALGINLPIQLASGKWAMQHDRTTNQTAGRKYATTRRIEDYEATSLVASLPAFVNGPNLDDDNRNMVIAVQEFLAREKEKGRFRSVSVDVSMNNAASIANGDYSIGINGQAPAPRERIFLLANIGPTVTVSKSL